MFGWTRRTQKRLVSHHLPLLAVSAVGVAALYVTRPYKDVLTRLSFATAYPALVLLALTLLIGPWCLLQGRKTPVSSDWRRDVGIWAGILSLLHVAVGQNVHLRGRPWLYYLYDSHAKGPHGLRHDLFGFNNFTGLAGALVVLALFVTSNDFFLRRLGTPQWKKLQRWNYACFALSAVHAVGYQVMEKQKAPFVATVVICIAVTVALQLTGYALRRRTEKGRSSGRTIPSVS
ncbi:MAG TPA: ferric reductase-like transmembrane domain-containing protein [Edaphobacter sp.]|nr:ferric reductase-like transmembrane domain-containing protein [Edaphobacter sp.]